MTPQIRNPPSKKRPNLNKVVYFIPENSEGVSLSKGFLDGAKYIEGDTDGHRTNQVFKQSTVEEIFFVKMSPPASERWKSTFRANYS